MTWSKEGLFWQKYKVSLLTKIRYIFVNNTSGWTIMNASYLSCFERALIMWLGHKVS